MRGAEADEVRTGSGRMAAFVSAIPLHLVYASAERRVHERAHELALDVIDSQVDGGGLAEVEAEVGSCVEGVGPNLERCCRYHCRCFGCGFNLRFYSASG